MSSVSVKSLLQGHNVMSVVPPKVITVDINDTPADCFKKLCDFKILSAPVLENGQFVGFVDLKDLVQYVVFAYDNVQGSPNKRKSLDNTDEFLKEALHHNAHKSSSLLGAHMLKNEGFINIAMTGAAKMYKEPAQGITVKYLSHKHTNAFVYAHQSLYDCCVHLARGSNRVAVLDNDNHVVNIISQSTAVKFLSQHVDQIPDVFNKNDVVPKMSHPAVTVPETFTALDTLRLMSKKNISGVPVLSETGEWIATTTGSDLKLYINNPSAELLQQPVVQFLSFIRQHDFGNIRNPTIAVHPDATLGHIIAKLTATKIHRLFITENSAKNVPIGVISLTDILHYLLPDVGQAKIGD